MIYKSTDSYLGYYVVSKVNLDPDNSTENISITNRRVVVNQNRFESSFELVIMKLHQNPTTTRNLIPTDVDSY